MTEKWVEIQEKQNLQFVFISEFELPRVPLLSIQFLLCFWPFFKFFISRHFWLRDYLMTFHFLFNKFSPYFSLMAPAKPKNNQYYYLCIILFCFSDQTLKPGKGGGVLLNKKNLIADITTLYTNFM